MVVLALISEPDVVRKILLHLGLPADVPQPAPATPTTGKLFFDDDATGCEPARPPP